MEDPQPQIAQDSSGPETPTQQQARLRRERREAKIKAGGQSRLEKITNVSGRQNLPDAPPIPNPSANNDPEEVDLSAASYNNANASQQQPTEADIRALLRGAAADPNNDSQQQPPPDDPMLQLLQQMMGGLPNNSSGDPSATNGLPPGLAAMVGGGAPASPVKEPKYAYIWKIIHALFALLLGIYVTYTSHAFTGDISRGGITGEGHEGGRNVFWAFATAEAVLQSGRYFLERKGGQGEEGMGGGMGGGGWMGTVAGVLPEPWRGWVWLGGRYVGIWSTVVGDGMVVVFVVGCVAWWRGAVG